MLACLLVSLLFKLSPNRFLFLFGLKQVFLSSDGNAVCSASDDNSIKFFQLESPSKLKQMHSWEPALSNTADKISFFHFLDDYNKLLENYQHELRTTKVVL